MVVSIGARSEKIRFGYETGLFSATSIQGLVGAAQKGRGAKLYISYTVISSTMEIDSADHHRLHQGEVVEVERFDDGTVVELQRKEGYSIAWYSIYTERSWLMYDPERKTKMLIARVRTPDGRQFEFDDHFGKWVTPPFSRSHPRLFQALPRALAWGTIWCRTGGTLYLTNNKVVPCNVAALGNAAIAVYLIVVYLMERRKVADVLGVKERTVAQYESDFLQGRR